MNNKDLNCSEQNSITCPTCKIKLEKKFLGERCPRCNAVVLPKGCEGCKKCFK